MGMVESVETLSSREPIALAEAVARFRAIFDEDGADGFAIRSAHADELREIGRRLAVAGGFRLMRDAYREFEGRGPDRERSLAAVRLGWRWDGVGGWFN